MAELGFPSAVQLYVLSLNHYVPGYPVLHNTGKWSLHLQVALRAYKHTMPGIQRGLGVLTVRK